MRTRYARTSLLDLPVWPYDRDDAGQTELVQDTYLAELKAIQLSTELRPFIRRWRSVWLLQPGPRAYTAEPGSTWRMALTRLSPGVELMLDGEFDAKRVLARVKQQPADEPIHVNAYERDWIVTMNLCLPMPFLDAFQFARHYGVGHDLGLVRIYLDSYPAFDDRLRGERKQDRAA